MKNLTMLDLNINDILCIHMQWVDIITELFRLRWYCYPFQNVFNDTIYTLCDVWHWQGYTPSQSIRLIYRRALIWCWMLLFVSFINITNSISFNNGKYDYYWDVGVHCYSFWITALGFLTLGNFGSAIPHPPGCFCAWTVFLICILNYDFLQVRSRLCKWLPLRCLVLLLVHFLKSSLI